MSAARIAPDPAPYVALAERAARAAAQAALAPPLDPLEIMCRVAIDRFGDVLDLDRSARELIFAQLDPVSYAGRTPSLILYFDEAGTLDSTGGEPELRAITGPDGAAFFHLLAACPACTRPVPCFEFETLAELGAAQAAVRGEQLDSLPARPSQLFAHAANHAPGCPACRPRHGLPRPYKALLTGKEQGFTVQDTNGVLRDRPTQRNPIMSRELRPRAVRAVHADGTVCTHRTRPTGRPENPAECSGRAGYATDCGCGWSHGATLRTLVDEQRSHHRHWTAAPEQRTAAEVAERWSLRGQDGVWRQVRSRRPARARRGRGAVVVTFDDRTTARFASPGTEVTAIPVGAAGRH